MQPCARHSIPQAAKARYYAGGGGWVAGQAEISLANGKTLYALDAFHVENGEIIEQQNHYDSRPATG